MSTGQTPDSGDLAWTGFQARMGPISTDEFSTDHSHQNYNLSTDMYTGMSSSTSEFSSSISGQDPFAQYNLGKPLAPLPSSPAASTFTTSSATDTHEMRSDQSEINFTDATEQDIGSISATSSAYNSQRTTQRNKSKSGTQSQKVGSKRTSTDKTRVAREKNRTAAAKCRRKAKRSAVDLQERERELVEENSLLNAHAGLLRDEILTLKSEILCHGTCDSQVIQDYIMKAAQSI